MGHVPGAVAPAERVVEDDGCDSPRRASLATEGDATAAFASEPRQMPQLQGAIIPVTPFQQNCAILWDEATKQAVIVDPGGDVDRILAAVEQTGVAVERIWLTHGHMDHAGGAAELQEMLRRRADDPAAIPIEGPDRRDDFLLRGLAEQGSGYGLASRNVTPDRWLREGDSVARLGGDEFVVVLEDMSSEAGEAAAQTESVAEKIRMELNKPYVLQDFECLSTVSIGISLFFNHQESAEDLLMHADVAMYQAKTAGCNTIRFFDPQMQTALEMRAALEKDLRHALAKQEFRLYYQIQVDNLRRPLGA